MSEEYNVKILKTGFITHNVKSIVLEKPKDFRFTPGQAADFSINTPELRGEKRPFTFTSSPKDLVLELTMKRYPNGITEKIHSLQPGDELVLGEVFGYFDYFGEGVFIAGGTGITPFLSIFRNLDKKELGKNKLIFSNKAYEDIICERELKEMLGENALFLLSEEEREGYINGKIDRGFLKKEITDFSRHFYVCGPTAFVDDIKKALIELGAKEEKIIIEK